VGQPKLPATNRAPACTQTGHQVPLTKVINMINIYNYSHYFTVLLFLFWDPIANFVGIAFREKKDGCKEN
jgi:hypothetical protein